MENKKWLISLVLLFFFVAGKAQEDVKNKIVEDLVQDIVESLPEGEEVDLTTIFDDLLFYYDHPINLNNATEEELKSLYLLSDIQINNLMNHLDKFGKLQTIYELQTIPGFDLTTIRMLLPFVRIKQESEIKKIKLANLWKDGNSDLFIRYLTTLEDQKGYSSIDAAELAENPNRRYLGDKTRKYFRYRYTYQNNLSFGVTGEKDPGEEFFRGTQKQGFDFYSAHLFYKGNGSVSKIALGDYEAKFGQGLTLWSGLAFGKSAFVMNVKKSPIGIKPYTSVDENKFMRGAAVTLSEGDMHFTAFYSNKKIDANRDGTIDTLGVEDLQNVTSFQSSGFHRTFNEIEDKDAIDERIIGGNLSYKKRKISIGLTGYQVNYGAFLNRSLKPYNQFEFTGMSNVVGGLDYSYVHQNMNVFGEVSRSKSGGLATLNGLMIALDPKFSLSILHRYYQKEFQNLYNNAFGENSKSANENGLFVGAELKFSRRWMISGYLDKFRFPWLKFGTDAPSQGMDYLFQITYKPSRKNEFYFRYKTKQKERNHPRSEGETIDYTRYLATEIKHSLRLNATYVVSPSFRFKSRMEWANYQIGEDDPQNGFMFYQDLIYKRLEFPVTFAVRYALMNIDSYSARIYAYENDLLYTWSIPAYSDTGSRFYIMAKWRFYRKMDLWVRYSLWDYSFEKTISSGLNEIQGNRKSELKLQLRIRF